MAVSADPIARFITYYEDVCERAQAITDGEFGRRVEKLCLVSVIDAVAKVVYPSRGNRDRFTRVISTFGGWEASTRVSLPHLDALLGRSPEPDFEPLRLRARELVAGWIPGEFVQLDRDLPLAEARALWPRDSGLRSVMGRVQLDYLQHAHLLYAYRNFLVHEFRDRPDALEMDDTEHPIYIHMWDFDPAAAHWDVFYPTRFFGGLARRVVREVGDYLRRNDLDPRHHLSSFEYLIEELCE